MGLLQQPQGVFYHLKTNNTNKMNCQFDTNHTLLEARLVILSKLPRPMSHPRTSYREGVSVPGKRNTQNKREKQVSPWKSQAMSDSVCGNNLINYMFTWRKLRLLCSSELMGHWVNVPPPKEAISEPVISCPSWTAVRLFPKYICCFSGAFLQSCRESMITGLKCSDNYSKSKNLDRKVYFKYVNTSYTNRLTD